MKKLGRPRKINYNPKVTIDCNRDILTQVLETKRNLGFYMTVGELEQLINAELNGSGVTVTLTLIKPKKVAWYKRLINWLRKH